MTKYLIKSQEKYLIRYQLFVFLYSILSIFKLLNYVSDIEPSVEFNYDTITILKYFDIKD